MPSEETQKFNEMMGLIQDSSRSFNEFKDEARRIVLRTRSFADNTLEYTTDAQDDDLELQDMEELLEEWRESNTKMEECIKMADTVKSLYNASFEKLKAAQGKAVDGQLCGMEKKFESLKNAAMCDGGAAAMVCLTEATLATGGVALPAALLAGGSLLAGGALLSLLNSENHLSWEKKFADVEQKLGMIYSLMRQHTDAMRRELIDLHHESCEILDKANRMANRSKVSRSGYFKLRCRRLGEQSAGLKRGCDRYISLDDDFAITGQMSQLEIKS